MILIKYVQNRVWSLKRRDWSFAFLFGAFAAHTTAQDLTQEQLDFIRANAAAVEAALQSGRTRRENEVRF